MKYVVSKISTVVLLIFLFSFSNVDQAYSALRNLATEFDEALKQLDIDKINSLLKEGLRDYGARKITQIAIAVSPFIRATGRSAYAVEIEKRCIFIIKAVSKIDKDFKTLHFPRLAELLTNPLLNALLEAGVNPNNDFSSPLADAKPIIYLTILNWRLAENVSFVKSNFYNDLYRDQSTIEEYAREITSKITNEDLLLSSSILNKILDEVNSMEKQLPMLLTREEVIERMNILVKYKTELTYTHIVFTHPKSEEHIIEFFLREFFNIFLAKMNKFENYSPDGDITFASEIIEILKKAGADTKSAKKYLEEKN